MTSDPNPNENILEEAHRLTSVDRPQAYSHPYDNFKETGDLMTALGFSFKGGPVTPEAVGMMMILVKLSREAYAHKRDNLTDLAGYARCLEKVQERKVQLRA